MADYLANNEELTSAVGEYLTRSFDSARRLELFGTGGANPQFHSELAELGWFALTVPEHHDGLGLPLSALGPIFATFGRRLVPGPLFESLALPTILIDRNDDPALAELLRETVAGRAVLGLVDPGITEDWGSDIGEIVLTDDGLHGRVEMARFAAQAHSLVVVARHGDDQVVCAVDASDPMISIEEIVSTDPAARYATVMFSGAHCGTAPLATGSDAASLISRMRLWARVLISFEMAGIAERMLELTVRYVTERHQFGVPIGSFQAVKHTVANMYEHTSSLMNLCLAALDDVPNSTENELCHIAVITKAYAADAALRVCESALQMHGGIGFTTEAEVHWYYKRALALRAWYGDERELHRVIGETVLNPRPATLAR